MHLTQVTFFFREWREHAHLTQKQLAERVGKTAATVSRIESGAREFSGEYLLKFAEAVGCPFPGDPINRPPTKVSIDELIERKNSAETERIKQQVVEFLRIIQAK